MKEITEQIIYFKIVRKTSKYNKYIKWFAYSYRNRECSILLSSTGYKTQKEAYKQFRKPDLLPVGDRLLNTTYIEIPS